MPDIRLPDIWRQAVAEIPAGAQQGDRAAGQIVGNQWHRAIWEEAPNLGDIVPGAFNETKAKSMGKEGEELFHLILSGIREIYDVDATIAGGAVRDLAAKVDGSKDVDVFIPLTWEKFNENSHELGWQRSPLLLKEGKYEGCVVPSTARAQGKVQYKTVDLVFLDKPLDTEMVSKFPIHAQRCVWTLNSGLCLSPEAKQDIENKTFTIDPTIKDKDRIKKVIAKAQEWVKRPGYNGWKIVEPDVAEWWEVKKQEEGRKYLPCPSPMAFRVAAVSV